jgi:hypothetical protein
VATKPPGAPDRWLVTLTEVEEVKAVARLLPIMATLIVYNAVYAQMTTLFILQGEGMNTSLGSLDVAPATVSGAALPAALALPPNAHKNHLACFQRRRRWGKGQPPPPRWLRPFFTCSAVFALPPPPPRSAGPHLCHDLDPGEPQPLL